MSGLDKILTKEVISADAKIIGTVGGIAVDSDNWKVPAVQLIVKKGNEEALGLKKKAIGTQKVYIATTQVSSVTDTVTLAVKMDQVKDVLVDKKKVSVTDSDLMKKKVVTTDGKQVGVLDDISFDGGKTWEITMIGVKMDKTVKEPLEQKKGSSITIHVKDVKTIGDMVMLRVDMDELKDYLARKPVSKK